MKNKLFIISTLSLLVISSLTGCNKKDDTQDEITDEMVTKVIESSNPEVEVNIGEYQSMINGELPSENDYHSYTSSSVLDAPKDYVTKVNKPLD